MTRAAVLVDLGFFLQRFRKLKLPSGRLLAATEVAKSVCDTARMHLEKGEKLYRIFVYDCPPFDKKAHNPVNGKSIDFSRTEIFRFRTELHRKLLRKRKVALRLGELAVEGRWVIRAAATKELLKGAMAATELKEQDVEYDIRQKGVDIKLGIDLASLAYKQLVERVVLITGDADFVPAAKLARREGLDVVLDPLWAPISTSLHEHIDGLKTIWSRPQTVLAA